jgi:hypothetical protein
VSAPLLANKTDYRSFAIDVLSIILILVTNYTFFVSYNESAFEYFNLVIFIFLLFVSFGLSIIMMIAPFQIIRVSTFTIVLLLFIRLQFGFGQGISTIAIIVVLLFSGLWILRAHASEILAIVFGTIIVAALGTSLFDNFPRGSSVLAPEPENTEPHLPVYVHIILDEMAGIEGYDRNIQSQNAIQRELSTFFLENGFRLFGRAYSPYILSVDSIPSLLNFKIGVNLESLRVEDGDYMPPNRILENLYFTRISGLGYKINVYQSSYLDFCSSPSKAVTNCLTYRYDTVPSAAISGLSIWDKAQLVLRSYGNAHSGGLNKIRDLVPGLREIIPKFVENPDPPGPIPALPVFDRLIKDASASQGGTVFFGHLLVPHFPYSVDSSCQIRRPFLTWNKPVAPNEEVDIRTVPDAPAARLMDYDDYGQQVRCALSKVKMLVDALKARGTFEDATIIIQGDHGSRISMTYPQTQNKDKISSQDFRDGFAALYAVKSPGVQPGYDTRMIPLPELLRITTAGEVDSRQISEADITAKVFLRPHLGTDEQYQEVPMPPFPEPAGPSVQ